jgi:hypothetical protein
MRQLLQRSAGFNAVEHALDRIAWARLAGRQLRSQDILAVLAVDSYRTSNTKAAVLGNLDQDKRPACRGILRTCPWVGAIRGVIHVATSIPFTFAEYCAKII